MPSPAMVFLPGFMCDDRLFGPQLKALRRAGIHCSVGDMTRSASIERMARQVLCKAPETFALTGLSMGGILALEIYRQAPERISHLALLNTTAREDASLPARSRQLHRVASGELRRVLRDELKPQYLAPPNRTPERLALLEDMGTSLGKFAFVRQTIALLIRPSFIPILSHISCPTLVLAGADDQLCPVDRHEEIAGPIANARLVILESCGHLSTLERPDLVTRELLALLNRNPH